jgi:hypothetical protein
VYEDGSYDEEIIEDETVEEEIFEEELVEEEAAEAGETQESNAIPRDITFDSPSKVGATEESQPKEANTVAESTGIVDEGEAPPCEPDDTESPEDESPDVAVAVADGNVAPSAPGEKSTEAESAKESANDKTAEAAAVPKAELRKTRKQKKEKFKGIKRFMFGKKKQVQGNF